MKKALVIAAVTVLSTSAFASKARTYALGNSAHLNDVQEVLAKPDKAAAYGEWATLETGATAGAGTLGAPRAEGGFVRMMGQSALGAYLGAGSGTALTGVQNYRGISASLLPQENPIRLFYATKAGDMNWGVGLYHTSSKKKQAESATTGEAKQEAMGLTASASTDVWDARAGLGLANNATYKDQNNDIKQTGKTTMSVGGGYHMDTMYIYGEYGQAGAKTEESFGTTTTMADRADTSMTVGVINSHKKDGTDFFYGISYVSSVLKDDADTPTSLNAVSTALTGTAGTNANKIEVTSLPLVVGIEAEATSWLVLRGSVSQTFGSLGLAKIKVSEKDSNNDAEYTGKDSTTVAVGTGIKWNKFMLDGVLKASTGGSTTGAIGTDTNFVTNAGLTYTF
jgi:hypothetical protein